MRQGERKTESYIDSYNETETETEGNLKID